jgi:hypothetical protein
MKLLKKPHARELGFNAGLADVLFLKTVLVKIF